MSGIKNFASKVEQAANDIFANQNSEKDVLKAKEIIEKVVSIESTSQNPLILKEKSKGFVSIHLVSPIPERYEFQICSFDLRFGDLTKITKKNVEEIIAKHLDNLRGQSSRY